MAAAVTHRNPECLEFHYRAPISGLALVPAVAGTTDGPTNLDRSTHYPSILSAVTLVPRASSFANASLPFLGTCCSLILFATLLVQTRVDTRTPATAVCILVTEHCYTDIPTTRALLAASLISSFPASHTWTGQSARLPRQPPSSTPSPSVVRR